MTTAVLRGGRLSTENRPRAGEDSSAESKPASSSRSRSGPAEGRQEDRCISGKMSA